MRFTRLRALVGIVVLTLALVAGIVGTTEPAAALDMDPNTVEWMCDWYGGEFTYDFDENLSTGTVSVSTFCHFDSGISLWCVDGSRGQLTCTYL